MSREQRLRIVCIYLWLYTRSGRWADRGVVGCFVHLYMALMLHASPPSFTPVLQSGCFILWKVVFDLRKAKGQKNISQYRAVHPVG